ncbi:AAA family ATPase [Streptomyces sp. NPDC002644]
MGGQAGEDDGTLVGRDAPWGVLREAVREAADRGRALWLRGEAGLGKTALLERVAAFAAESGLRVLRFAGSEQEADLAFGVLHQLVWSLPAGHRDALTDSQRLALERALGTEQGEAEGGLAVAAATLALLGRAAEDRPVLLVVDDLQWVDASSARILSFVQRRLAPLPVVMAVGLRTEGALPGPSRLDSTGARLLDLAPLTDAEATALLERRHPELGTEARARLLREAAGNPLALVELPAQLDRSHRTGRLPLPEDLPLGERIEQAYAARLAALEEPTRRLLLLCALAGPGQQPVRLALEAAAAAGEPLPETALEPAERAGLVRLQHARLTFGHPLVRACVVRAASAAERRRAHRALAAALPDDERRDAHLAAAAIGPDEALAGRLERAAERTARRGGHPEAVTLLTGAARLSPHRDRRGARLTAAAHTASVAGQVTLAADLLAEAEATGAPTRGDRALWDFTDAYVRFQRDGDLTRAAEVLPDVLAAFRGGEDTAALHGAARFLLHLTATCSNRPSLWEALEEELPHSPPATRLSFDVWHDPAAGGHGGAERLRALVAPLTPRQEGADAWPLLWIAAALDEVDEHAQLWHRLAQQAPYLTQAYVDNATCLDDWVRGRWDRCLTVARKGARTARERGCGFHARMFLHAEARVYAGRGQRDALEAVAGRIEPWARARGQSYLLRRLTGMRATCALTLGEYDTAFALAASLTPPGTFPAEEPHPHHVLLDLVEAALDTGRRAAALAHVAAARARRLGEISPHHAFVLAAAEAVTAGDDEADDLARAVRAMPGAEKWPFELARVQLRHGRWLRRRHRPEEAQEHLRAAHAVFGRLAAGPWQRRAAEELRAAGAVVASARPAGEWGLTAQEARIARLVASGLTNGEIAERLKVSPRTIGTHLYKIFPKVNVSSRAALAHAVRSADDR